ncbi:MAG: hypothetical protein BZY88_00685 [SAR202 cluster bacterium Io17-Chloro-G9]|nr:MAG: hypothetical protein BZY88_00685 [SAR202 cluster bacterium Io17-Chloro-G9]
MAELNLRSIALAVLGALAGALVTAAVVLLAQGDGNAPIQVLLPTPDQAVAGTDSAGALQAQSSQEEVNLMVDIRGAVHNPGVYTLPPGSRLENAVEAAGGVTDEADRESTRLSIRVQDEGYYYIRKVGETPRPAIATALASAPTGGASVGEAVSAGVIDLNTATVATLGTLPGIGEVRAKAIVDYREANGCFRTTSDITKVIGIGSGTYENIRELVTANTCP